MGEILSNVIPCALAFASVVGFSALRRISDGWRHVRRPGVRLVNPDAVVDLGEMLRSVRTGDLILFSCEAASSQILKFFSLNPWTHCGMVYRDPTTGVPHLWHSDGSDSREDLLTRSKKRGPQLIELEEYLLTFDGLAVWRSLDGPEPLPEASVSALEGLIVAVARAPFSNSKVQLICSTMRRRICVRPPPNYSEFFCSEMLALAMQVMGLLDGTFAINSYHPHHWADGDDLPLREGYRLGAKVLIDPQRACK